MQPRSAALLWDLVTAATRIQSFIAGKTWEDYGSDLLLRSGVERQLEIAGEAMSVLRNLDPDTWDESLGAALGVLAEVVLACVITPVY